MVCQQLCYLILLCVYVCVSLLCPSITPSSLPPCLTPPISLCVSPHHLYQVGLWGAETGDEMGNGEVCGCVDV